MKSQSVYRFEYFSTDAARMCDPYMLCFDVLPYVSKLAFFSADFASYHFSACVSDSHAFPTIFNHGLDLFIQLVGLQT